MKRPGILQILLHYCWIIHACNGSSASNLGVMFICGASLAVDCCFIKRKFYAAYNSISGGCKYANRLAKLHLIKSYCLPLLIYCTGAIDLPKYKIKDLSVCWNDYFRKIFKFQRWESIGEVLMNLRWSCHNSS